MGFQAAQPSVSADGVRVAFVRYTVGQSPEVWIANRDGGGARDLSNHAEIDHHPALSPDGGRVAFASWRDGSSDIWVVSADGTGLVNLTPAPDPEEGGPADAFPAWSPDGQWLAYRQMDHLTGETDIAVVRSTGGAVQVIEMAGDQLGPAWSPDGRRIAFGSTHDENGREVYVMSPEGTGVQRWTNNQLLEGRPAWLKRPWRGAAGALAGAWESTYVPRRPGRAGARRPEPRARRIPALRACVPSPSPPPSPPSCSPRARSPLRCARSCARIRDG
ncbi:MAG TPA: hypothetical protein VFY16_11555 [Gemmatimonadaceae bacterium]|nr:hypothetical protein [Gemmatimonadaceae bacterium]